MNDRSASAPFRGAWTIALVGVTAIFSIVSVRFANQQSVWTDESTQLSGLSLGFADQLRWLAGRLPDTFAVPPDRTPPLSYWLGSLWEHFFGASVRAARYFSVFLSVAAIFAIWTIARQYLARSKPMICAALLAFSPNFLVEAVEVRAYAAFIFFSTLLIFCYLQMLERRRPISSADLWAFSVTATLCSYTHFFRHRHIGRSVPMCSRILCADGPSVRRHADCAGGEVAIAVLLGQFCWTRTVHLVSAEELRRWR